MRYKHEYRYVLTFTSESGLFTLGDNEMHEVLVALEAPLELKLNLQLTVNG